MKILGIETSCDETAAAIIEANDQDKKIILVSNVVTSSLVLHAKTGGIIPEVAAREQVKYIIPVIEQALKDSNLYLPSSKINPQSSIIYRPAIDAIAVTVGPGLIGSLLIGVETAKVLAYAWNKPIIPVNHLIGHIYANFIQDVILEESASWRGPIESQGDAIALLQHDNTTFPALALIVSGGHTDLVLIKSHKQLTWIGGTRDDAAGEAFDKIGRLLGLSYPAGPEIANLAEKGYPKAFAFPRPMIGSNDFDFSFSGLKTAVYREVSSIKYQVLSSQTKANICASVQQAIIDVLVSKTAQAAQKHKVKSILLSGGVAANTLLRQQMKLKIESAGLAEKINLHIPHASLCTDNAAMIATAAFFKYKPVPWQKITANPSLHF